MDIVHHSLVSREESVARVVNGHNILNNIISEEKFSL